MTEFKYSLGDEVKDRVTGFVGIVAAQIKWINGCLRYVVQPQEVKDGKPIEGSSFDEGDLRILNAGKVEAEQIKEIGGPQPGDRLASRR